MTILITGAAGFIGFHVAKTLLTRGEHIVAVDNLNDYYDVSLCLLYTSPSPRDATLSRMPSSA